MQKTDASFDHYCCQLKRKEQAPKIIMIENALAEVTSIGSEWIGNDKNRPIKYFPLG